MCHYRTLSRVDNFLNRLFLEVGGLISRFILYREEIVGHELQLHVKDREGVREPYFDQAQSTLEGRRAFLSHNACTEAVTLYAGILAYLVQALNLPVAVQEVTLTKVQPDREIVLIMDSEEIRIADYHNLFIITATSTVTLLDDSDLITLLEEEGLYTDMTAHQYGKQSGLTSVKAYAAMGYWEPDYIGARYHHHILTIQGSNYKIENLVSEAIIRTINNAFIRECDTFDGLTSFSSDDEVAHAEGVKRLIKAVLEDVCELQSDLDAITELNGDGIEPRQRYKNTARKCAGAGHSRIMAVLTQASNKPLGWFECF